MRIIATSDMHGMHRDVEIPLGDMLIVAGDITGRDKIEEIYDFNDWLHEQPHHYKIVIAGNHDGCLQEAGPELSSIYLSDAIYLENSFCIIGHEGKKYKVWGSPFTPMFLDWYFMEERNKIKKYWDTIPNDTDIVITHGPGWGTLDEVEPSFKRGHLGCEELTKAIARVKPQLHIFGHIHDGYGVKKNNDTLFINASTCNEEYEPINLPVIIDI